MHLFPVPNSLPDIGVVNKLVLGLRSDLDVIQSLLRSWTRTDFYTQPPLPHGSFLWWVRYTWGCQMWKWRCRIRSCLPWVFKLKRKIYAQFEPLGEISIYSQIPLILGHLVITRLRIRNEPICSAWLAVLKGKTLDRGKPQNPHVIIVFIIFVSEMTKASESSISFSAQGGFKVDRPDRNSYIMSHVYIKHGFT